jgi:hypothetical protein
VTGLAHTFGAFFAGIGGFFMLLGVLMAVLGRRNRQRGVEVAGTIVGYGFHAWRRLITVSSGNGPSECPIVEFQTLEGKQVRALARNGSSPRPGRVGAPITVHYRPNKPESFYADTGRSRRVAGCLEIAFILFGALFLFVGITLLTS